MVVDDEKEGLVSDSRRHKETWHHVVVDRRVMESRNRPAYAEGEDRHAAILGDCFPTT